MSQLYTETNYPRFRFPMMTMHSSERTAESRSERAGDRYQSQKPSNQSKILMSLFPDSNKPSEKPIGLSREVRVDFDNSIIRYSIFDIRVYQQDKGRPHSPPSLQARAPNLSKDNATITSPAQVPIESRNAKGKNGRDKPVKFVNPRHWLADSTKRMDPVWIAPLLSSEHGAGGLGGRACSSG